MRILVFLVFLGTITFSNQVWASSINSDTVTTTTSNFSGTVSRVIDGDTLDVLTREGDTITIRLALIDAPERNEPGFNEAKNFITEQCLNKNAEVDPDNMQGLTYGRTVAVVYCEGVNVNEVILDNNLADIYQSFCDVSEFADTNWAQEHGCSNNRSDNGDNDDVEKEEPVESDSISNANRVDTSDTSKDLDCKDFDEKNIPVGSDDPHNLDADGDGIGCEG
ncbi:thermonuclease family protein [Candidatus Nitrosocosmicus sp. T]